MYYDIKSWHVGTVGAILILSAIFVFILPWLAAGLILLITGLIAIAVAGFYWVRYDSNIVSSSSAAMSSTTITSTRTHQVP